MQLSYTKERLGAAVGRVARKGGPTNASVIAKAALDVRVAVSGKLLLFGPSLGEPSARLVAR